MVEGHVGETLWRFESSLRHQTWSGRWADHDGRCAFFLPVCPGSGS